MPQRSSCVFLFGDTDQTNLWAVLELAAEKLGLCARPFSRWDQVISGVRCGSSPDDVYVLDPAKKGFDSKELFSALDTLETRPKLVLVRRQGSEELSDFSDLILEESLDLDASIRPDYSIAEFVYVLQRVTFPEEENSRMYPRALTALAVKYGPGEGEAIEGEAFNLSAASVFIKAEEPHPKGTVLHLAVHLDETEEPVCCKGKVVFCRHSSKTVDAVFPPGMGVSFTNLGYDDKGRLERFVNDRLLRVDREVWAKAVKKESV